MKRESTATSPIAYDQKSQMQTIIFAGSAAKERQRIGSPASLNRIAHDYERDGAKTMKMFLAGLIVGALMVWGVTIYRDHGNLKTKIEESDFNRTMWIMGCEDAEIHYDVHGINEGGQKSLTDCTARAQYQKF